MEAVWRRVAPFLDNVVHGNGGVPNAFSPSALIGHRLRGGPALYNSYRPVTIWCGCASTRWHKNHSWEKGVRSLSFRHSHDETAWPPPTLSVDIHTDARIIMTIRLIRVCTASESITPSTTMLFVLDVALVKVSSCTRQTITQVWVLSTHVVVQLLPE